MREIALDTERTLESTLEKGYSSSRREEEEGIGCFVRTIHPWIFFFFFFLELIQYEAKEREKSSRNYANVYMEKRGNEIFNR